MSHTMNRSPRPRLIAALVPMAALALGLTACTSTQPDAQSSPTSPSQSASGSSTPEPSDSATPGPTPSSSTSEDGNTTTPINGDAWTKDRSEKSPSVIAGKGLIFHDIRAAAHDGFYRVVIEFAGEGQPGWNASWADRAVEQARGRELPVAGTTFLDIGISGTMMPQTDAQQQQYYSGPVSLPVGPVDAYEDGTFEDITHIVIGLDKVRGYQIGTLQDPVRVVIDIQQ